MRKRWILLIVWALSLTMLQASMASGTIRFTKPSYQPNEPIEIAFENLPGNQQDWITLIEAGTPDDKYGEWFYTRGARSGRHSFAGKPAGHYEIRVYHNWPAGGYVVRERVSFTVQTQATPPSGSGRLRTVKAHYRANEPVEITFQDFPGNKQDWITLVKTGTPDDKYGEWFYTGGARSGRHSFDGQSPGSYEIRAYFDWPAGGYIVRERLSISIGGN